MLLAPSDDEQAQQMSRISMLAFLTTASGRYSEWPETTKIPVTSSDNCYKNADCCQKEKPNLPHSLQGRIDRRKLYALKSLVQVTDKRTRGLPIEEVSESEKGV